MKKDEIEILVDKGYEYGFETSVDSVVAPKGLNEEVIRFISAQKHEPEWLLEWRLKAYHHWLSLTEPHWGKMEYPPIDYQDLYYWSAPKKDGPKSLGEVDPEILKTYENMWFKINILLG